METKKVTISNIKFNLSYQTISYFQLRLILIILQPQLNHKPTGHH